MSKIAEFVMLALRLIAELPASGAVHWLFEPLPLQVRCLLAALALVLYFLLLQATKKPE